LRWASGGLSRYLDELLHAMAEATSEDERLIVYYNSRSGPPRFDSRVTERFVRFPNRTAWNQVRLPMAVRADGCHVYLGGAIVTPLALRTRSVPVIHDCLVFRDRTAKPGAEGRYWRRWTRLAARRAGRVIAVSRFVADDCTAILGVDPSMVRVVYSGVSPAFSSLDAATTDERRHRLAASFGVPHKFVLHVGAYEPHKDPKTAVDAVRLLASRGRPVTLVRCGPAGSVALDVPNSITLGRVDDATLIDLYRCAEAVLVTSTHEGFGLPVLEAMACGTPVVAARAGGIPEAGGDVAVYAEPRDVEAFAGALAAVLDAPADVREARRETGIRWAGTFTWDRTARQVLDVLRDAAASRR
jgi:glycosyltransferase involved in cell wall biosynthesis